MGSQFESNSEVHKINDAGMQMSLSYFRGVDHYKIQLAKQMNVLGVVGKINEEMGICTSNYWSYEAVRKVKEIWDTQGLKFAVVEGPPALSDITKLGLAGRDNEISNFIDFMKNLSQIGVRVICYNWMPVIGWYRTDNERKGRGGALVTAFNIEDVKGLPMTQWGEISKQQLWKSLTYFLNAVIPEAEQLGVKLAMHPDDPQISEIRGISRIMGTLEDFNRLLNIYQSPSNGITFCQANFSLMTDNIPALIKYFGEKKAIHFVHFRNIKGNQNDFEECFHDEGKIKMAEAMQAYYDIGFRGAIRPDHVPTMGSDSNNFPGYSTLGNLYACGYIRGLMDSIKT